MVSHLGDVAPDGAELPGGRSIGRLPAGESGWDTTTDPLNPQPLVYPVCPDCGASYDYRRALSLSRGVYFWAWFRPAGIPKGCKHKAPATINTAAGTEAGEP